VEETQREEAWRGDKEKGSIVRKGDRKNEGGVGGKMKRREIANPKKGHW
jgi:hypothetical protein